MPRDDVDILWEELRKVDMMLRNALSESSDLARERSLLMHELNKDHGVPQREIARFIGISQKNVSKAIASATGWLEEGA